MELQKARNGDFSKIRAFYDLVIDNTKDMEKHARWKRGSHPFDDVIKDYIKNGEMYMCCDGEDLIGVMAVQFKQDEEYHQIEWGVTVQDNEVATLHIFAIAPKLQGMGYGKKAVMLALELARSNSMKAFRLDALFCNTPAHKLYEAVGFKRCGTQTLYTDNAGWIDFYYYEMSLDSAEHTSN